MVNVCALSVIVVALVITVVTGHGPFFNQFQQNVKCARNVGQSQFGFYTPYVNRALLIRDLEAFDKDNNDDITQAELSDWSPIGLDLVGGVRRCEFVETYQARYGLKVGISNPMFTMLDGNNDGILTRSDITLPPDTNGDGKISVCEMYNIFLDFVDVAAKEFFDRKLDARRIKANTDYYNVANPNQFNPYWNSFGWRH